MLFCTRAGECDGSERAVTNHQAAVRNATHDAASTAALNTPDPVSLSRPVQGRPPAAQGSFVRRTTRVAPHGAHASRSLHTNQAPGMPQAERFSNVDPPLRTTDPRSAPGSVVNAGHPERAVGPHAGSYQFIQGAPIGVVVARGGARRAGARTPPAHPSSHPWHATTHRARRSPCARHSPNTRPHR